MGAQQDTVVGGGFPAGDDVLEIQGGAIIGLHFALLNDHIFRVSLYFFNEIDGTLLMGARVRHPRAECQLHACRFQGGIFVEYRNCHRFNRS